MAMLLGKICRIIVVGDESMITHSVEKPSEPVFYMKKLEIKTNETLLKNNYEWQLANPDQIVRAERLEHVLPGPC
jgi:hypothetical protein